MTTSTHEAAAAAPWADPVRPTTPDGWIRLAQEVAAVLEEDAVERDRAPVTPHDEIRLLRETGLVTLLGPVAHGGAGQHWGTAHQVIRRVAEGDASTARLLGLHYLWSQLPALFGTAGQAEEIIRTATREGWFFGGTVDPRDPDLAAADTGRDLLLSGRTTFPAGSEAADVVWLEAAIEGHEAHVLALAPSDHPGITVHHGSGGSGQQPPGSGTVTVSDVVLPWRSALGWVDKQFVARSTNALALPTLQLVVTNVALGVAARALRTSTGRAREGTGDRLDGGDPHEHTVDQPYAVDTDPRSTLRAAQALADRASDALELLHIDPDGLEPPARREVAALVAAAEQRAVDIGPGTGTRVHGDGPSRVTATSVRSDRLGRTARTHAARDPIADGRGVGVLALLDEAPGTTWHA